MPFYLISSLCGHALFDFNARDRSKKRKIRTIKREKRLLSSFNRRIRLEASTNRSYLKHSLGENAQLGLEKKRQGRNSESSDTNCLKDHERSRDDDIKEDS